MLRCCARRRDGALERLRGDVIDLPYKPTNITKPQMYSTSKKDEGIWFRWGRSLQNKNYYKR